jgi:hypothetical protein
MTTWERDVWEIKANLRPLLEGKRADACVSCFVQIAVIDAKKMGIPLWKFLVYVIREWRRYRLEVERK